jgi:hypothetical protein
VEAELQQLRLENAALRKTRHGHLLLKEEGWETRWKQLKVRQPNDGMASHRCTVGEFLQHVQTLAHIFHR